MFPVLTIIVVTALKVVLGAYEPFAHSYKKYKKNE